MLSAACNSALETFSEFQDLNDLRWCQPIHDIHQFLLLTFRHDWAPIQIPVCCAASRNSRRATLAISPALRCIDWRSPCQFQSASSLKFFSRRQFVPKCAGLLINYLPFQAASLLQTPASEHSFLLSITRSADFLLANLPLEFKQSDMLTRHGIRHLSSCSSKLIAK